MTRQLDLISSIKKLRMLALSTISMLNTKQRIFVRKLGDNFTTHDESELNSGSDSVQGNSVDTKALAEKFSRSDDKVDQRLSMLYKISSTRFKKLSMLKPQRKSLGKQSRVPG